MGGKIPDKMFELMEACAWAHDRALLRTLVDDYQTLRPHAPSTKELQGLQGLESNASLKHAKQHAQLLIDHSESRKTFMAAHQSRLREHDQKVNQIGKQAAMSVEEEKNEIGALTPVEEERAKCKTLMRLIDALAPELLEHRKGLSEPQRKITAVTYDDVSLLEAKATEQLRIHHPDYHITMEKLGKLFEIKERQYAFCGLSKGIAEAKQTLALGWKGVVTALRDAFEKDQGCSFWTLNMELDASDVSAAVGREHWTALEKRFKHWVSGNPLDIGPRVEDMHDVEGGKAAAKERAAEAEEDKKHAKHHWYEILGVKKDASKETVHAAWKKRALDLADGATAFRKVRLAYEAWLIATTLSDEADTEDEGKVKDKTAEGEDEKQDKAAEDEDEEKEEDDVPALRMLEEVDVPHWHADEETEKDKPAEEEDKAEEEEEDVPVIEEEDEGDAQENKGEEEGDEPSEDESAPKKKKKKSDVKKIPRKKQPDEELPASTEVGHEVPQGFDSTPASIVSWNSEFLERAASRIEEKHIPFFASKKFSMRKLLKGMRGSWAAWPEVVFVNAEKCSNVMWANRLDAAMRRLWSRRPMALVVVYNIPGCAKLSWHFQVPICF